MAQEWILNQAMNRWGLNKKKSVGAVSDLIRKCAPKNLDIWRDYYYKNAYPESHLEELGKKLYIKISEVVQYEVAEVKEADCIEYMKNVVINRTFQGYHTEIQTVYGQLQNLIEMEIKPAPDEWDRLYNVDFFLEIKGNYIGFQIKPISFQHTFENYRWEQMQSTTHEKFRKKYNGQVFIIYSAKTGSNKKEIQNPEIIDKIKEEIKRLSP